MPFSSMIFMPSYITPEIGTMFFPYWQPLAWCSCSTGSMVGSSCLQKTLSEPTRQVPLAGEQSALVEYFLREVSLLYRTYLQTAIPMLRLPILRSSLKVGRLTFSGFLNLRQRSIAIPAGRICTFSGAFYLRSTKSKEFFQVFSSWEPDSSLFYQGSQLSMKLKQTTLTLMSALQMLLASIWMSYQSDQVAPLPAVNKKILLVIFLLPPQFSPSSFAQKCRDSKRSPPYRSDGLRFFILPTSRISWSPGFYSCESSKLFPSPSFSQSSSPKMASAHSQAALENILC